MKDDSVSVRQLFLHPEQYAGRRIVAKGRLHATTAGVFLSQQNETIKLNISSNDLLRADKKAWMFVGGKRLYDHEALVAGVFSRSGDSPSSFEISEIDTVCLLQSDMVNEMNLREASDGAPPSMVEI
jgi:hypothetical protein